MSILYVALGGAIGASARHLLSKASLHAFGPGFPWGTFMANILGGLLMGVLVGWLAHKSGVSENVRLFLGVGVLGGFTTFSAFSLETMLMIEKKAFGLAAFYAGSSVALSIFALFLGLLIVRRALGV